MHGVIKSGFASALSMLTDAEVISRVSLGRAPHVSKHRQHDRDGNRIRGACKIADNSSITKRMRAWRRECAA